MNTDTAYADRQELIKYSNCPHKQVPDRGNVWCVIPDCGIQTLTGEARESTESLESLTSDSRGGRQSNLGGGGTMALLDRRESVEGVTLGNEATGEKSLPDITTAAQSLPDTWEAIAAQLDHWRDMDAQYWQQRREKAYAAWMERTYGV